MVWDIRDGELFDIWEPPEQHIPLILNSPHSGRVYPRTFVENSRLDQSGIRRSEDFFVDELFFSGVRLGAPMLCANFPRAYVDVNREPYELDPRMNSTAPASCWTCASGWQKIKDAVFDTEASESELAAVPVATKKTLTSRSNSCENFSSTRRSASPPP